MAYAPSLVTLIQQFSDSLETERERGTRREERIAWKCREAECERAMGPWEGKAGKEEDEQQMREEGVKWDSERRRGQPLKNRAPHHRQCRQENKECTRKRQRAERGPQGGEMRIEAEAKRASISKLGSR